MSIMDYENELADAQAITVTAMLTNVIDLNTYPGYIAGEDLFLTVPVNTAFAGGTSIRAVLWTHTTATVTSGSDIISGDVVLTAAATAGSNLLRVNLQGLPLKQFVGVQAVVVGTMSAGAVDSYLETTPSVAAVTLS